ncbi:hypothetical protein TRIUR3_28601 [Triticum urartu]|uniref:Uncharacterized protein n=1 Tax=Triticum urartu TaxID=4572 RepID=M8AAH3_TRIUA|nr:hypothetical protein TRIUR3_28601 [Triticum urartu]
MTASKQSPLSHAPIALPCSLSLMRPPPPPTPSPVISRSPPSKPFFPSLSHTHRLVAGMVWGSTAGQIEYANESAILLRLLEMDNTAANFALSKEAVFDERKSGPRGTYGQMHLDCMSIKNFTKKSHKSTNKLA